MQNVLILFAHPAFEKSRVNRRLVDAIRGLDGVTFNDLYDKYPEFDVDVKHEQALLLEHDVIVPQHPFYWYSIPPLLKQWQELVLEHGWAYGVDGSALSGKTALSVISTGGSEEAYQPDGHNRFTMRQLLAPLEQTAFLCGMEFLPPFVVHGTHQMTSQEMSHHADDYRRTIEALRDGTLDLDKARLYPRLNSNVTDLLPASAESD